MQRDRTGISDDFVTQIVLRASQDRRVRRFLPGGGRIHLDRRLPFLCVYRQRAGTRDNATEQLISGEAASFVVPGDPRSLVRVRALVRSLVEALSAHFGGFLVLEIWCEPGFEASAGTPYGRAEEALPQKPVFTVVTQKRRTPQKTVEALSKALRRIRVSRQQGETEIAEYAIPHPPMMKPLLLPAEARELRCFCIGLQVRPIYRDPTTQEVFPTVLRSLRRGLGYALKRAFFTFAREHTEIRPQHYYSLGRRSVLKIVWEVDRRLAEIDDSFDLLLQATPVNADSAWHEFKRLRCEKPPPLHYRPLSVDPALLKRDLYDIPVEKIEDPTLAHLFLEKQDALGRKITMLSDVGTMRFLPGSLQVYGAVATPLLSLARQLLQVVPPRSRGGSPGKPLDAKAFAERAREEIEGYRAQYPDFTATVAVRDDIYSGLLVSQGHLLVGKGTRIQAGRVESLLQHEVGTHLITYYNGRAQPLRQLASGLAGYDGLQEGVAVLSEYLVGGLDRSRIRLLAARVLAVEQLLQGASFVDTFHLLNRVYQFSQRQAYTITMRIYRGGGLTKDLIYLQGLSQILDYLQSGGEIGPLITGKIGPDHIPIVRELRLRHVLRPPPLRPRYLDAPGVSGKLDQLRRGRTVLQLLEEITQ